MSRQPKQKREHRPNRSKCKKCGECWDKHVIDKANFEWVCPS